MIPVLGKYAATVLGAYGVALGLLAVLTILSILRSRRVKRDLAALEDRRKRHD